MTLHFAVYRAAEVTIGSLAALLVVALLAPAKPIAPAPTAPGWSDLLDARWPAVLHGIRTGVAVLLMPWTWSWFDLPGLPQVAASVSAVTAMAALSDYPLQDGRLIAPGAPCSDAWLYRRRYRGAGGARCLARRVPALDPRAYGRPLAWRVRADEQARHRLYRHPGIGRPIIMIVQGGGPPDSILPAIDRFAGILAGLAILLVVSLLLWPEEEEMVLARCP